MGTSEGTLAKIVRFHLSCRVHLGKPDYVLRGGGGGGGLPHTHGCAIIEEKEKNM